MLFIQIGLIHQLSFAVVFRLVVFRPFPSEVLLAKVKSSDEEGIRRECDVSFIRYTVIKRTAVTVGFFDDMYIPLSYLPNPAALYVSLRLDAGRC